MYCFSVDVCKKYEIALKNSNTKRDLTHKCMRKLFHTKMHAKSVILHTHAYRKQDFTHKFLHEKHLKSTHYVPKTILMREIQ